MPSDSSVELNIGSGGALIATDLVSGKQYQVVKIATGGSGLADEVSTANPMPVTLIGVVPLSTNAAQENGGNLGSIKSNTDNIPAQGQAVAAASLPVVLPATQITALTPPAAISGFNLESTQLAIKLKTDNIPALGQALAAASVPVVLTAAQIATLTPPAAITGFNLEATQVAMSAKLPATLGAKTTAQSLAVNIASDQNVNVKPVGSTTGTGSTASISASATVLAANTSRLGATIYNESGGNCRIKLGSTASATDYSVIIAIGGYYEVPFSYNGIITGIAVSGTAVLRITEIS